MKVNKKMLVFVGIFLLVPTMAFAAVEELVNSYNYYYNNGTINITSFNSYMADSDGNSVNDTLVFDLATDVTSTSIFLALVDVDNKENILTGRANKTLSSGNNNFLINLSSALLSKDKFNYTVRIYSEDNLIYRKSNLTTNFFSGYENGFSVISVADQDISNTYLRITVNVNATAASTENITVFLEHNNTMVSATKEQALSTGAQNVDIDFDNETIKRTHYNGKFLVDSIQIGSKLIEINSNTSNSYNYEDFAKTSYIKAIASEIIDNNSNNLADYLRINFTIDAKSNDIYSVKSKLYDPFDNFITELEKNASLSTGVNTVSIDVLGADVYSSYLDGPYALSYAELLIVNETQDFIFEPYRTNITFFHDFERPLLPDLTATIGVINLTGNDTIQINVTNQGQASAVNVFVEVFDNSTFSKTFSLSSLNMSETTTLEINTTNSNREFYIAVVDFDNLVDEINESNNIIEWEKEQFISLTLESISTVYANGTLRIFEFIILNNGDTTVSNVQWRFDTGDNFIINSTSNISSLSSGEKAFVYIQYNYSEDGSFSINASATGISQYNEIGSSLTQSLEIGDLSIIGFDAINVDASKAILEIQAKNIGEAAIESINWSIDTGKDSILQSIQYFNLDSGETIFIFAQNDYAGGGTYNPIAAVASSSHSSSKAASVTLQYININNLGVLNESGNKRIFSFDIENGLSTNLTEVNWTFNTKNSNVINATSNVILQPNEKLFVYVDYNYTSAGTFNTNTSA